MVSEAIRGVSWGVSVTRAWTDALIVRPSVAAISRVAVLIIEQVSDDVLEGDTIDRILDRAETAGVAQRIADRLLADGIAEELANRILSGPELERVVELALESPGVERIIARVVESRVVDETVARVMEEVAERLPQSAAMWALIDEIAQSPAVSDAITQQGAGFADQVADEMRERSRTVDERLERAAWRLFRRRPRAPGGGDEPSPMGAT